MIESLQVDFIPVFGSSQNLLALIEMDLSRNTATPYALELYQPHVIQQPSFKYLFYIVAHMGPWWLITIEMGCFTCPKYYEAQCVMDSLSVNITSLCRPG